MPVIGEEPKGAIDPHLEHPLEGHAGPLARDAHVRLATLEEPEDGLVP
jgi:hypothetical protein